MNDNSFSVVLNFQSTSASEITKYEIMVEHGEGHKVLFFNHKWGTEYFII